VEGVRGNREVAPAERSRVSRDPIGVAEAGGKRPEVPPRSYAEPATYAVRIASVHFRLPSIDPGVRAFLWAFFLALYIWLGLLAVGVDGGTSLIAALLSFGAIFLYVRLYGGDARP
jgi:hypothetical protein